MSVKTMDDAAQSYEVSHSITQYYWLPDTGVS